MTNPLFLNTILLGGSTDDKLQAAKAAGFDQIELWRQDVEASPLKPRLLNQTLADLSLGLTDYQVLLDFDGAPPAKRDAKRAEAMSMLDTAVALGATTLLTPASTDPDCDLARVVDDVGWLAEAAAGRGLRIAYEAMAWSTFNNTLVAAWDVVRQLGAPNLGLVVDAFHIFVRGRDDSDLDGVPMDKIYLVQLSDLAHPVDRAHLIETARHARLLPGQGRFPLRSLVARLRGDGYDGPIGLEVFNDEMKARAPDAVAREAFAALSATMT